MTWRPTMYIAWKYLWLPRPTQAQGANLLPDYERQGWWAQAKLNGNGLILGFSPDRGGIRGQFGRAVLARTRHGDQPFSRWTPGANLTEFGAQLPGKGWFVFAGELLHTRGVGVKDTIYLFDVLVCDGEYLVGQSFEARQECLATVCGTGDDGPLTHTEVWPRIWRARNWSTGFSKLWDVMRAPHVEGLVLKNAAAPLEPCLKQSSNSSWQAKCRYATAELSY